jgi:hypothetical protein
MITSTPAIAPMMNAPTGVTNAHGAVIATRPASMLLHIIVGSGLPTRRHMYSTPDSVADMPAIIVLVATMPIRPSLPASELPALKPNQPNARMNVPSCTIGMWWARIGLTVPSGPYLPIRGPIRYAVISASAPPCRWTTPEPA